MMRSRHHEQFKHECMPFVDLLKDCAKNKDISKGSRLHTEVLIKGLLHRSPHIATTLIHMYVKCGMLAKAQRVLEDLPFRALYPWNALISGYTQHGRNREAIDCFENMKKNGTETISPDGVTFACVLKACGNMRDACRGQEIHGEIVKRGLLWKRNIGLGNALVDMYAKCGMLRKAQVVLKDLHVRDVISWNALISGYAQHGQGHETLDCLDKMQQEGINPDVVTYISILKGLGSICASEMGGRIHDEVVNRGFLQGNVILGTALVDMYAKCGNLLKAKQVFEELPIRDIVAWSALIAGYAHWGHGHDALRSFLQMQREGISPNEVTLMCVLKACGSIQNIVKGEEIHDTIVKEGFLSKNIRLGTSLVDMYAKCGLLVKAHQLHKELLIRNVVSWNALIAGYVQHGKALETLDLFAQMQREGFSPDGVTFSCLLRACSITKDVEKGKEVHDEIFKKDMLEKCIELCNALVDMYAKCGMLSEAGHVFREIPLQDVVSWNTLISGYVQDGKAHQALDCFGQMQKMGLSPDRITFACVLGACGHIGAITKGQKIHNEIINRSLIEKNIVLGNALIDMYVKCGLLSRARQVLDGLRVRDIISWSTLIAGHAKEGHCYEALNCFHQMQSEGLQPNEVTFVSVLNACSHSGRLNEAEEYYKHMSRKYGFTPKREHDTCMVVVLGSVGLFCKAMALIESMPSSDDPSVWIALLGACKKWGNVRLGRLIFNNVIQLGNDLSAAYVLMSSRKIDLR